MVACRRCFRHELLTGLPGLGRAMTSSEVPMTLSLDQVPLPEPRGESAALGGLSGYALDRHLFGRIVALAATDPSRPLTEALGLSRGDLARLLERYLPDRLPLLDALPAEAGPGAEQIEEPDYRAYLLECRAGEAEEEVWLAAIVARRSQSANHLWQDMGFADRGELNLLLRRHFPELVRRNAGDMKWKKFIYRELCQREGVLVCKSPNCAVCSDFSTCFSGEPGAPLQTLAGLARTGPGAP